MKSKRVRTALKVPDLQPGQKVQWDENKPVVTVEELKTGLNDEEGAITVIARAECSGPQGGRVVLETTSTGRNRAKVGHSNWTPPYTVDVLTRVY